MNLFSTTKNQIHHLYDEKVRFFDTAKKSISNMAEQQNMVNKA
jgi:hypothetical protein